MSTEVMQSQQASAASEAAASSPVPSAPAPDTSAPESPDSQPTPAAPAPKAGGLGPEPTLREKIEAKAKAVQAREKSAATKAANKAAGAQAPAANAAPAADPAAAWKPREKFKVLDKEHDIPAWAKAAMKDPETEKAVVEHLEKAFGLDVVKPKFQSLREEHKTLREQHQELASEYQGFIQDRQELVKLYKAGDLDLFFDRLNIPEEKILKWAVERAKYYQLPEDQRQVYDERSKLKRQGYESQQRFEHLDQSHQETVTKALGTQLQIALAKPDVTGFAQTFDEKFGEGAFMNEIVKCGETAYYTRKDQRGQPVNLTPEQAIKEVMDHYGKVISVSPAPAATGAPSATPPAQAPSPAPAAPAQQAQAPSPPQAQPPVIPNVSGKATSATSAKPAFRSIDDLKKHAAQLGRPQQAG
jgi:hypothetical protein